MAFPIPQVQQTPEKSFRRLLDILHTLRKECPWDKEQTMESLRHLTLEEVYELADAILDKDYDEIKKELGDVLLHLVFYAKIAEEQARFDIVSVLNEVCDKLIARHPHIYGNVQAENEEAVKSNWEALKLKEGTRSVLAGVPKSLPALVKAFRIQDKVRGVGFDWDDSTEVWNKVEEEMNEFKEAFNIEQKEAIRTEQAEEEFGDLLFSLINYARHIGINPENALEKTNKKFIDRFVYLEKQIQKEGKSLMDTSLAEMNRYWEEAKSR